MKLQGVDFYFRRNKTLGLVNSKISKILPELMDRNLKLADRLQNKLKVSSFFNSIERRNQKYLQNFIFSSDKRTRDLKTGEQLGEVIKHSSEKMSLLCNQIDDDIIIKNMEKLNKEKKLLFEKTEQETHNKIEELLNNLRTVIKKPKLEKRVFDSKIGKSFTPKDINEIKEYIGEKIKNEEKKTNDKICRYLKKLNYIFKDSDCFDKSHSNEFEKNIEDEESKKILIKRRKALNKLADNFYLKKNIKLINYSKPKPFQLQDKEGANLKRIKNCLYPSLVDKTIKNEKNEENLDKSDSSLQTHTIMTSHNETMIQNDINKNSSVSYINSKINPDENKEINKLDDDTEKIKTNGKETYEILNILSTQGKSLSETLDKKFEKVNSLIDFNLPCPKNYELILNFSKIQEKEKERLNNQYILFSPVSIKQRKYHESRNYGNKTLLHLDPNIKHKLTSLKDEIQNKKIEKNMFDSVFRSYIGFNTTKHDKSKWVMLNRNLKVKKIMEHKASMDNIKQKKNESVFITLKKNERRGKYK